MSSTHSEILGTVERLVEVFDPHRLYGNEALEFGPLRSDRVDDRARQYRRIEDLTAIPISAKYMQWCARCKKSRKNHTVLCGEQQLILDVGQLKTSSTFTEAVEKAHLKNAFGEFFLDGQGHP